MRYKIRIGVLGMVLMDVGASSMRVGEMRGSEFEVSMHFRKRYDEDIEFKEAVDFAVRSELLK